MTFDEIKQLAIILLQNYETAWQENTALRLILQTYPMPDGSKGIPQWKEITKDWIEHGQSVARSKFSPLYERIHNARQESDLLELLRASGRRSVGIATSEIAGWP